MTEIIKTINVCGGYGKESVIKDVSFSVNRGEFVGIIGPNGSGKTTLLRLMSRVLLPKSGKVEFSGKDISALDLRQYCQKVAFVQQESSINFSFSVMEMVLMGRIPHLKRLQQETNKDMEIAENSLFLTGSLELKDKLIDQLSSGERQRITIAKALAQEPVLMFLDEPTSHLDIGHQIQIMDLLKKLNSSGNLTIIMVLHDLNLAAEYCNRIILLNDGKIFKEGVPEDVLTYQNIEAVYKTIVVVEKNPINLKPHVILVSEEKSHAG